jgi:hypothetical protein
VVVSAIANVAPFSKRLVELAARLKAAHGEATAALRRGIAQSIAAGVILIDAKKQMKHGQWQPWLRLSGVPARTARRYMYFASNRACLEDQNGHVADLTVRTALNLLTTVPGKCRRRGDPSNLEKPFYHLPIDVFDTRTEAWQSRKRAWLALGIRSELGRDCEVFNQRSLNGLMLQRRGLVAVLRGAAPPTGAPAAATVAPRPVAAPVRAPQAQAAR